MIKDYKIEKNKKVLDLYTNIKSARGIFHALKRCKYKVYKRNVVGGFIRKPYMYRDVVHILKSHGLIYDVRKKKPRNIPIGVSEVDYEYAKKWAKTIWAFKQGGGECQICGHSDPRHLVFHHRDPKTKKYTIATILSSTHTKDEIIEEINKCELLCVYCHKNAHIQTDRIVNLSDTIKKLVEEADFW